MNALVIRIQRQKFSQSIDLPGLIISGPGDQRIDNQLLAPGDTRPGCLCIFYRREKLRTNG